MTSNPGSFAGLFPLAQNSERLGKPLFVRVQSCLTLLRRPEREKSLAEVGDCQLPATVGQCLRVAHGTLASPFLVPKVFL
jgi:hypothetical protein